MHKAGEEARPAPRWRRVSLGGVLLVVGGIWKMLERADVIDGALSLASEIGPWLADHAEVLAMLAGLGLIVYEIGRPRGWWKRFGAASENEPSEPASEPATPAIAVSPRVDYLSHAYPAEYVGALMFTSHLERSYAVLRVRNEAATDWQRVVARCALAISGEELPCFWSKEPGKDFVPGNTGAADLDVWHERLLVVAQVFGKDRLWARLPADQIHLFSTVAYREGAQGGDRFVSPAGELLDLGKKVEILIRFRAVGLDYRVRLLLSFDVDGPTVEVVSTPSADPAPSKPSG